MTDFLIGSFIGFAEGVATVGALYYVYVKFLKGKTL